MHLILLSGENLELARLEAESLLKLENTSMYKNRLYCTIPTDSITLIDRLSYTKRIYEIAYNTHRKNLENSLKEYPWINVYEKNFCLRITSSEHYDERYYSTFIWKSLEQHKIPKVNLKTPNLLIEIFIEKDDAIVTRLLYQNFESFEDRKAHKMPHLHPTTMHPKMARALINILNPDKNERLIDPFCGACGIITEAAMLGIDCIGYDIDDGVLESAKKNLNYQNIDPKKYELFKKDSTTIKDLKNVVTDLPYGKSSKKNDDLKNIYAKFLKNITGRTVVVMPNFLPYNKLLKDNVSKDLEVKNIISHYVHKSLTREIIVIDKKDQTSKIAIASKKQKSNSDKIVNKTQKLTKKPTKKILKVVVDTKKNSKNTIRKFSKNKKDSKNSTKKKAIKNQKNKILKKKN